MKEINLNANIKMPMLGLGTFRNNDESVVINTVLTALKIGYRNIDTAKAYNNEEYIGRALKMSGLPRKSIFITTKIKIHPNEKMVRELIEDSLTKLQTSYLDLVLIHWPSHDYDLNYQTYSILEEYYNKGIIKAIGVSNFSIHHLANLISRAKIKPQINQVELHPGLNQIPLQKYLNENNIALQSYGPFMKGNVFSGNYFDVLNEIANNHLATIAQIVIAWGLNRNIVMIPMSTNPINLETNFKAKDINLSKEEIEKINKLNVAKRVYSDPDNNSIYLYEGR
ncbi:MAG TPA: aldo/keto reductase [Acholeplasmataceae bacterium]|nr:aldo/keto reductase [Acholeplasmataceae bacterium]